MSLVLVNIDDQFLRGVARRLAASKVGVERVFTATPGELACLGQVRLVDSRRLYRAADVAYAFPGLAPAELNRVDLVDLLECERHFLITSDRTAHIPVSVKERKRLFRELVRYFTAFMRAEPGVRTFFFESTPHMGWDIVLFYIARRAGRETLILSRTLLPDRVLLLSDFRCPPPLADAPAAVDEELIAAISAPSAWSEASAKRNRDALAAPRRTGWKAALLRPVTRARLSTQPARFVSAMAAQGLSTPLEIADLRALHARRSAALRAEYDRVAGDVPDGPFVYFALHFQPERTTQPEALEFEDQLLALDLLSRALPPDWNIVVKEHPRQFETSPLPLRLRHARTAQDYAEMKAIARVHFARLDEAGDRLLARCSMAATVTGSTGWEAMRLGKPALVFAPCWYARCGGVGYVTSLEEARAAFARLASKSAEEIREELNLFVRRLAPTLIRSTTAEAYARRSPIAYDELIGVLAAAVEARAAKKEQAA